MAIAANSAGVNVSRAVGPALGGAIAATLGVAAPFWINAISEPVGDLRDGVVASASTPAAPASRRAAPGAVQAGLRYAFHNSYLRSTLIRTVAFFLFGSAYWALLPLVARSQIAGGPGVYGVLLGAIGAGAVGGALLLPALRARLNPDRMVMAGTLGTALAMILYGLAKETPVAIAASLIAGASWIAVLASLNVSAQVALPEWVRARGLAVFVTAMYGAMTLGSATWGEIAAMVGLPAAHLLAAAGAAITIPLTWRWKLQAGAGVDLTPSLHWAPPVTTRTVKEDEGPVLVTVEYVINPADRDAFVTELTSLSRERRRDGAYRWGVWEDTAQAGRFVETFLTETWMEHLRHHGRVTHADQAVEELVDSFQVDGRPITTHYIAA